MIKNCASQWQLSSFIRSECCDAPVVQVEIFITLRYPIWCIKCNKCLAYPSYEDIGDIQSGRLPRGYLTTEEMHDFMESMTSAVLAAADAFRTMADTVDQFSRDSAMFKIEERMRMEARHPSHWPNLHEGTWEDPQSLGS